LIDIATGLICKYRRTWPRFIAIGGFDGALAVARGIKIKINNSP